MGQNKHSGSFFGDEEATLLVRYIIYAKGVLGGHLPYQRRTCNYIYSVFKLAFCKPAAATDASKQRNLLFLGMFMHFCICLRMRITSLVAV